MGCHYANSKREVEAGLERRCAFCRERVPYSDEESDKKLMKRIKENNDPAAMCHWVSNTIGKGVMKQLWNI